MRSWAFCREELEKLALDRAHYLYRKIDGVCSVHGIPLRYRDLAHTESYCPLDDEEVKEKRAALNVQRIFVRKPSTLNKMKSILGMYKKPASRMTSKGS